MDVSPLYLAADHMDGVADVLLARARLLALGAATTRWHSPAARTYFARIDGVTANLTGCALRVSVLADRVRSHAFRIAAAGP